MKDEIFDDGFWSSQTCFFNDWSVVPERTSIGAMIGSFFDKHSIQTVNLNNEIKSRDKISITN
jgi:hypothetical protein